MENTKEIDKIKILGILSQILYIFSSLGGLLVFVGFLMKIFLFYDSSKIFNNKKIFKNYILSISMYFLGGLILTLVFIFILLKNPVILFSNPLYILEILWQNPKLLILTIFSYIIFVIGAEFYRKTMLEFYKLTEIQRFKTAGNLALLSIALLPVIIGFFIGIVQIVVELIAYIEINPEKLSEKLKQESINQS